MSSSRKYPNQPQGMFIGGRGVSKVQFFKGKYDGKLESLEGWGVIHISHRGVWIFPGTTQW